MDRPHSHASILYCSGQSWKLWAMVIATAVALIMLVVAEWFRESMSFSFNVFLVSFATAAAAGAIAYPVFVHSLSRVRRTVVLVGTDKAARRQLVRLAAGAMGLPEMSRNVQNDCS
jgi:hypothetical protein